MTIHHFRFPVAAFPRNVRAPAPTYRFLLTILTFVLGFHGFQAQSARAAITDNWTALSGNCATPANSSANLYPADGISRTITNNYAGAVITLGAAPLFTGTKSLYLPSGILFVSTSTTGPVTQSGTGTVTTGTPTSPSLYLVSTQPGCSPEATIQR